MKKFILGLGTIGAVVAPIATVVACGDEDHGESTTTTIPSDQIDAITAKFVGNVFTGDIGSLVDGNGATASMTTKGNSATASITFNVSADGTVTIRGQQGSTIHNNDENVQDGDTLTISVTATGTEARHTWKGLVYHNGSEVCEFDKSKAADVADIIANIVNPPSAGATASAVTGTDFYKLVKKIS